MIQFNEYIWLEEREIVAVLCTRLPQEMKSSPEKTNGMVQPNSDWYCMVKGRDGSSYSEGFTTEREAREKCEEFTQELALLL